MFLSGKIVVVTGGGSGMGRELVLALLARGAKVAAIDLNREALDQTKFLAGLRQNSLSVYTVDITDMDAVEKLPQAVIAEHGGVDILINNAGIIQPFVRINDLDYDHIDRVMKVNFYGLLYMTKAFLPFLLERKSAYIVNTSSMGGFLPVPGQAVYGASKAAVKLFTEALYAELKPTRVKVSVVFPGAVDTNITKNSGVKAPKSEKSYKSLSAKDAAEAIICGIEKNKMYIFVGSDSKFMNCLYRMCPKFATDFISKKMGDLLG